MNVNRHMVIPMDAFEDVAQIMAPSRGDLFKFGMNPFNGNIVVSWQDNPTSRFFIRMILAQFARYPDLFDEEAVMVFCELSSNFDEGNFCVDSLEVA